MNFELQMHTLVTCVELFNIRHLSWNLIQISPVHEEVIPHMPLWTHFLTKVMLPALNIYIFYVIINILGHVALKPF